MTNWVKIDLFYLGESKKNYIFRARSWNNRFERLMKKPIFNEEYEKIGTVHDIFGPIANPFLSIKNLPNKKVQFTTNNNLYAKI